MLITGDKVSVKGEGGAEFSVDLTKMRLSPEQRTAVEKAVRAKSLSGLSDEEKELIRNEKAIVHGQGPGEYGFIRFDITIIRQG